MSLRAFNHVRPAAESSSDEAPPAKKSRAAATPKPKGKRKNVVDDDSDDSWQSVFDAAGVSIHNQRCHQEQEGKKLAPSC
ncbi:hypothetical protein DIPPA_24849 [Diplonema papillatum]|nr:hypothetical protein DIPPA_24849 [Diplonema papillatum]KAJ9464628.1 hypothetical protein DIPPA_24849 [Diplonema papillatum]